MKKLQNPERAFDTILGLITRLAEHGLIHCDFNEFNLMVPQTRRYVVLQSPLSCRSQKQANTRVN